MPGEDGAPAFGDAGALGKPDSRFRRIFQEPGADGVLIGMNAGLNRWWSGRILGLAVLVLLATGNAVAKDGGGAALDAGDKSVVKQEVRYSMLGVRDTVVFYSFPAQQAVLRVRIGNADTSFPLTAELHTFAAGTTAESLKKWVNNQHSDALFADAPQPTATHKIPSTLLKIESHQRTGRSKQHNGEFDDYKVKFRIGDFAPDGGPELKGFAVEATVHVKAG